jgi:serine/threonine protein kinase
MKPFRLTKTQLAILSSLSRDDNLQKLLVESVTILPRGSLIPVKNEWYRIENIIGSGMTSVVYKVSQLTTAKNYALKLARVNFTFLRQLFDREIELTNYLSNNSSLKTAKIVNYNETILVKELHYEKTLLHYLRSTKLNPWQISGLEIVIKEAAKIFETRGYVLDLTPKNIVWDENSSQWLLLDLGPKIHYSSLQNALNQPCLSNYFKYIELKGYLEVKTKQTDSYPSVLDRQPGNSVTVKSNIFYFLRDCWMWFPYDRDIPVNFFHAEVASDIPEDEILFKIDLNDSLSVITHPDGPENLKHSNLIKQIADNAWNNQFGQPGSLIWPTDFKAALKPGDDIGPIEASQFIASLMSIGLGKILQKQFPNGQPPERPKLKITPYEHWSELNHPESNHKATDIFTNTPLKFPLKFLNEIEQKFPFIHTQLPLPDNGSFCEMMISKESRTNQAIVFVPGFRATPEAAASLAAKLLENDVKALFVSAWLGIKNTNGQRLISCGRWESILLWSLIDYLSQTCKIDNFTIIAASHGCVGANIVAAKHPMVSKLILDCPVKQPIALLKHFAAIRKLSFAKIQEILKYNNLPYNDFKLNLAERSGLKTLILRRKMDSFLDLCKPLEGTKTITYEGRHAATMRHDSLARGIPEVCIKSILHFLNKER